MSSVFSALASASRARARYSSVGDIPEQRLGLAEFRNPPHTHFGLPPIAGFTAPPTHEQLDAGGGFQPRPSPFPVTFARIRFTSSSRMGSNPRFVEVVLDLEVVGMAVRGRSTPRRSTTSRGTSRAPSRSRSRTRRPRSTSPPRCPRTCACPRSTKCGSARPQREHSRSRNTRRSRRSSRLG
jgi:hypothetical protein